MSFTLAMWGHLVTFQFAFFSKVKQQNNKHILDKDTTKMASICVREGLESNKPLDVKNRAFKVLIPNIYFQGG